MTIDLTAQIHQYLTTAPSSLFAQQEVEMLAQWEGDANLLWRVRAATAKNEDSDAVVKLFLEAGQARSRRQFDGHSIFAPRGFAPQPLWADRYPQGLSRQLIVYRWIDGESVNPGDPGELSAWADTVARLHAAPTDEVRRFSPHPLNLDVYWRIERASIAQVEHWLAATDLALKNYFQQLAAASEQLVQHALPLWEYAMPTPIHGDLSRQHTIIERGRVLLLDWEMFGLGDPAMDVARMLQREAQGLDAQHIKAWLDRYLDLVDQPALGERIDLSRRLLDTHNAIYLLVGLQQHTAAGIDDDLRAALPFMQDALTTALARASSTLMLPLADDYQRVAAEFVTWLLESPPTAPH